MQRYDSLRSIVTWELSLSMATQSGQERGGSWQNGIPILAYPVLFFNRKYQQDSERFRKSPFTIQSLSFVENHPLLLFGCLAELQIIVVWWLIRTREWRIKSTEHARKEKFYLKVSEVPFPRKVICIYNFEFHFFGLQKRKADHDSKIVGIPTNMLKFIVDFLCGYKVK